MNDPLPPPRNPEPVGLAGEALDQLFERVAAATVDRPPTLRDRLRELPAAQRGAATLLTLVLLTAGSAVAQGLRPDLDPPGWARFLARAAPVIAAGGIAGLIANRPFHARPLGSARQALAALALASPLAIAAIPGWAGISWTGGPSAHASCFVSSGLTALGAWLLLRYVDQAERSRPWALLVGAGAGGLVAFVAQTAHCPIVDRPHLLFTHGLAGSVVAVGGLCAVALAGVPAPGRVSRPG